MSGMKKIKKKVLFLKIQEIGVHHMKSSARALKQMKAGLSNRVNHYIAKLIAKSAVDAKSKSRT